MQNISWLCFFVDTVHIGNDIRRPQLLWNANKNSYAINRLMQCPVTMSDP